MQQGNKR